MGWRTATCGARPVAGRRPASGLSTERHLLPAGRSGMLPSVLTRSPSSLHVLHFCAFDLDLDLPLPSSLLPTTAPSPPTSRMGGSHLCLGSGKGMPGAHKCGDCAFRTEGRFYHSPAASTHPLHCFGASKACLWNFPGLLFLFLLLFYTNCQPSLGYRQLDSSAYM